MSLKSNSMFLKSKSMFFKPKSTSANTARDRLKADILAQANDGVSQMKREILLILSQHKHLKYPFVKIVDNNIRIKVVAGSN